METASNSEKIIGVVGMAAVIVFFITMLIASSTNKDFALGSGTMGDLLPEPALVAGCIISGILGAVFGLMITFWKPESKVFIAKVRGLLIVLSGVALIALGATSGNDYAVYLLIALLILSAASDTFYNWVVDQKILMVISLILTLFILVTGILSQTSDNSILAFVFAVFVAIWICLLSVIRFIPFAEVQPQKKDKKGKAKENEVKKKNAPAPRPYPAKKEEPKKTAVKPAEKKVKEEPKVEEPKKKETKPAPVIKTEPKKEEPKPAEPKKEEPKPAEPKKEEPKPAEPKAEPIKVMSSKEAAAARDARKKEEQESVKAPEPVIEPEPAKEEPAIEPEPAKEEPVIEPEFVDEPEAVPEPESEAAEIETDAEEEDYEDFDIMEDTPDALLRRATWNKGLRCRRYYGEFQIPIAYVKAKVAVFVQPEPDAKDASVDAELRANGWTLFHYLERDITDGKEQAEEINKAVKENLKAERAAKKKKSSKK